MLAVKQNCSDSRPSFEGCFAPNLLPDAPPLIPPLDPVEARAQDSFIRQLMGINSIPVLLLHEYYFNVSLLLYYQANSVSYPL